MRILLFGKTGQVGWELQRSLAPLGDLIALDEFGDAGPLAPEGLPDRLVGDLEDIPGIKRTILTLKPDVVVNAAAYTAVDRAEFMADVAMKINGDAPAAMAEAGAELGALLVHYSTDYVFDGSGDRPWREDDEMAPINEYGRSKAAGDRGIVNAGARHLIFRTQWVFASRGHNFIRTMLKLAEERDSLQVINDQFGAPTSAELIADVTATAIRQAMQQPELSGVFNLVAAGETTWHGFATAVIERARELGRPVKVAADAMLPVASDAFQTAATRPKNSRLSLAKIESTFGVKLPDWRFGVERALAEILEQSAVNPAA